MDEKWVKIITEEGTFNINDNVGFMYLDFEEEDVETTTNSQEIKGTDGIILGANTFAPFNLKLRFVYVGADIKDYHLFKSKLRGILYRRKPFYVVHSDMPGKKYAVVTDSTEIENVYDRNGTIDITFNVYKGYSESLYDTDQFSLGNGNWQFESGLLPDNTTAYRYNKQMFEILNGSSDTIDPRQRHKLKIIIRLNTSKGFSLVNKTTGDVFEFKSDLDINRQLTIDGGYPYMQVNDVRGRCGRLTNHGLITLAPGINKFEIWGTVTDLDIQFIFPFIYR